MPNPFDDIDKDYGPAPKPEPTVFSFDVLAVFRWFKRKFTKSSYVPQAEENIKEEEKK